MQRLVAVECQGAFRPRAQLMARTPFAWASIFNLAGCTYMLAYNTWYRSRLDNKTAMIWYKYYWQIMIAGSDCSGLVRRQTSAKSCISQTACGGGFGSTLLHSLCWAPSVPCAVSILFSIGCCITYPSHLCLYCATSTPFTLLCAI
jgi:hypothetical protein